MKSKSEKSKFEFLADAYISEEIDSRDEVALEKLLLNKIDAQKQLLEQQQMEQALSIMLSDTKDDDDLASSVMNDLQRMSSDEGLSGKKVIRLKGVDRKVSLSQRRSSGRRRTQKKSWSISRIAVVVALAGAAVFFLATIINSSGDQEDSRSSNTEAVSPKIISLVGRLQYKDGVDENSPLQVGQILMLGKEIELSGNGQLKVKYADSTELHFSKGAKFKLINQLSSKSISLIKGEAFVIAAKQPQGHPLLLKTSHFQSTIVGTEFTAAVSDDEGSSSLHVSKGLVKVYDFLAKKDVLVRVGDTVFASADQDMTIQRNQKNIMESYDFDLDSFSDLTFEGRRKIEYAANIVKSPGGSVGRSLRFELQKKDPRSIKLEKRSMCHLKDIAQLGDERWYSVRIFIPSDYERDDASEILVMWGSRMPKNLPSPRSPQLSLGIEKGVWVLKSFWETRESVYVKPGDTWVKSEGGESKNLGSVEKDAWVDWVFHVKWSYEDDGLLEIWKNDKKVIDKKRANSYRNEVDIRFFVGIDKWAWMPEEEGSEEVKSTVSRRVIFADEIRVGNQKAKRQDMLPAK